MIHGLAFIIKAYLFISGIISMVFPKTIAMTFNNIYIAKYSLAIPVGTIFEKSYFGGYLINIKRLNN